MNASDTTVTVHLAGVPGFKYETPALTAYRYFGQVNRGLSGEDQGDCENPGFDVD